MSRLSRGRVQLREILDLVGAVGDDPDRIEEAVRHLYDWHNSRGVAGMQLTFAPLAGAILAIATKPESTTVWAIAIGVAVVSVLAGVCQLYLVLNWLHREYAYAVRLAVELSRVHGELALYPHGRGAPEGSDAGKLYKQIGDVTMVKYRSDPATRERVLGLLPARPA